MTRIVIVSKTKMKTHYCIGAVVLSNHQSIRLLDQHGDNQPLTTKFEIGDVWDVDFNPLSNTTPPHTEDVLVAKSTFVKKGQQSVNQLLKLDEMAERVWRGHPNVLFEGMLGWTGKNNGYISKKKGVPNVSVGFWIPDNDLHFDGDKHYVYSDDWGNEYCSSYVGIENPPKIIKAGTIVRVSLARWWKPEDIDDIEERCYLQLSGWYN